MLKILSQESEKRKMTKPKVLRRLSKLYKSFYKDYERNIKIYFSSQSLGDSFNPRENNYVDSNLNPMIIKGIVTEISPEKLMWKPYGTERGSVVEVLLDAKYKEWIKLASKIEIDSKSYMVYKEATGNNVAIHDRPFQQIRVILTEM